MKNPPLLLEICHATRTTLERNNRGLQFLKTSHRNTRPPREMLFLSFFMGWGTVGCDGMKRSARQSTRHPSSAMTVPQHHASQEQHGASDEGHRQQAVALCCLLRHILRKRERLLPPGADEGVTRTLHV
eukprot:TRINITY_DN2219_c0_g2_i5.p3 TRINITY_DN2219_c0_g2~~TRINITY_DN2219_c0_g2_i5.p3  ORF type:complete len:129 (-),score=5.57 TRINITY_DN2219_c0_g2_i5:105-491(-)